MNSSDEYTRTLDDVDGFDDSSAVVDRAQSQKLSQVSQDEIAELVDAVTGATWNTRNAIMAERFRTQLASGAEGLPAFRPAGT